MTRKPAQPWYDDEAAVLAVCLTEGRPDCGGLTPECFGDGFNRELARVLAGLPAGFTEAQARAAILQDSEAGRLYRRDSMARIDRVLKARSTGVFLARDVARVREWARKRTLKAVGERLARAEADGRPVDGLLSELRETLAALDRPRSATRERVGEILADDSGRLAARRDGRERPIVTPWPSLNRAIGGGLWPGLVTLTAVPGAGKTQAALQLLLEAARAGIPALYVGLELDRLGVTARLLALAYGHKRNVRVPWSDLYLGTGTQATLSASPETIVDEARAELANLPLYLAWGNPEGWSMSQLEADIAAIAPAPEAGQYRPVLAVVDFLQLVAPEAEARGELRETIRTAAYRARAIARKYNVCVVLVSSTAREQYPLLSGERKGTGGKTEQAKFADEPPGLYLGTGKESGEIEYAADLALVLCRHRWREGEAAPPIWCAVAKQRAGKPAWVELAFDGAMLTDPEGKPEGGGDDGRY